MAAFRSAFTAGVTVEAWEDPALGDVPSRINPNPEHGHKRHVGSVGVQITLTATVGGVVAPLDAALGGKLFKVFFAELPAGPPPALSNPVGQSSVQRFTPTVPGHYSLRLALDPLGGSIFHHVDVEA